MAQKTDKENVGKLDQKTRDSLANGMLREKEDASKPVLSPRKPLSIPEPTRGAVRRRSFLHLTTLGEGRKVPQ